MIYVILLAKESLPHYKDYYMVLTVDLIFSNIFERRCSYVESDSDCYGAGYDADGIAGLWG